MRRVAQLARPAPYPNTVQLTVTGEHVFNLRLQFSIFNRFFRREVESAIAIMDNPLPDRPPDRAPPPANIVSYLGPEPANVLPYHGPAPQRIPKHVVYERDGETLTITIPPPPFSTPIILSSLALLACGLPMAAITALVISEWRNARFHGEFSAFNCIAAVGSLLALGMVRAVRRLIYWGREGRMSSVVRVDPHGLEIRATGSVRPVTHYFRRDCITELHIHPGAGLNPRLFLQIVTLDDQMYLASLPWCAGQPMIEVEDNLRDVLGLPPTDRD